MLIFLAIFLVAIGVLIFVNPKVVWGVTDNFTSYHSATPSPGQYAAIRIGGIICVLAGLASAYLHFFQP